MRIKIILLVLVVILFSFAIMGASGQDAPATQGDEYNAFIPIVFNSGRCILPESTKAECLQ
jgi:hypothetical protein